MASLFKSNGFWWITYNQNGKRFRFSTRTRNRNLAKQKLNDIELKLFKGELGIPEKKTPNALIPQFFRRYMEYMINSSPVNKHADLSRIRIMQEFFARKQVRFLESITPAVIDEFRIEVLAGKKPKTVKNYIGLLKTALNKAVEWDLIDVNPIAKVKLPKVVKTFNFFNQSEIKRMIDEAEEPLKTGIFILVSTGMRTGELFHLRWRDVDLGNNKIRVWPYEGFSPKGKRPRSIPMSSNLREVMVRISKEKAPDDYIFRPFIDRHKLYKGFKDLLKSLGMKGTLHDLRHSFASSMAMVGTPIPVIKELLGHADIATTMIYAHLSPHLYQAAIDKLPFEL